MDAAQEQKMKEWLFGILTEKQKDSISYWLNEPNAIVRKTGLIISNTTNKALPDNYRDSVLVEIKILHGAFNG